MTTLYIVKAFYDGTYTDYEYSNIAHAESHYKAEQSAMLILYQSDNQTNRKTETILQMKGVN